MISPTQRIFLRARHEFEDPTALDASSIVCDQQPDGFYGHVAEARSHAIAT